MIKYLFILIMVPAGIWAANVVNAQDKDPIDSIVLEFGRSSCLIGYYQNFIDNGITRPSAEQKKQSEQFCTAYAKACVKKLHEN